MAFIERYGAWQAWLVMRDTSLVNQATFAISLVAAYLLRDWLPAPLREPLRVLYLLGGIPLYLFTLGIGLLDLQIAPATAALIIAGGLPVGLAVVIWQWRRGSEHAWTWPGSARLRRLLAGLGLLLSGCVTLAVGYQLDRAGAAWSALVILAAVPQWISGAYLLLVALGRERRLPELRQ